MGEITYVRDLGLDHQEFFRLLPRAMWRPGYEVNGNRVLLEEGSGKRFEIEIAPVEHRRLSVSFSMPMTRVSFTFRGYTQEEADRLMDHIYLHYQRGGG